MSLQELEQKLQSCSLCKLSGGRKNVVFARGNPQGRIMLIGEGPGGDEDAQGLPFVGKAGQLLDKIIAAANLPPNQIYICNVVKCRPPGNRLPEPDEVDACKAFLREQIRQMHPPIIVCLGALATQVVVSPQARITRDRGRWVRKGSFWIMPTFHPAALLRDESKKRLVWQDILQVKEAFLKLGDGQAGSKGGGADVGDCN